MSAVYFIAKHYKSIEIKLVNYFSTLLIFKYNMNIIQENNVPVLDNLHHWIQNILLDNLL